MQVCVTMLIFYNQNHNCHQKVKCTWKDHGKDKALPQILCWHQSWKDWKQANQEKMQVKMNPKSYTPQSLLCPKSYPYHNVKIHPSCPYKDDSFSEPKSPLTKLIFTTSDINLKFNLGLQITLNSLNMHLSSSHNRTPLSTVTVQILQTAQRLSFV